MTGGRAHGEARGYQELCRDIIERVHRFGPLEPYSGDGIDVAFNLGRTTITFDIALKSPDGSLVVGEAKRWADSVPQGEVLKFAHSVEKLRQELGVSVAAFFIVGSDVQSGALGAAADDGVEVVIFSPNQPWPNHAFTFVAYDEARERRIAHNAYIYENVGSITDHVNVNVRSRSIVESIGPVSDHASLRVLGARTEDETEETEG
jgi:hypothetical protein